VLPFTNVSWEMCSLGDEHLGLSVARQRQQSSTDLDTPRDRRVCSHWVWYDNPFLALDLSSSENMHQQQKNSFLVFPTYRLDATHFSPGSQEEEDAIKACSAWCQGPYE